MKRLFIALLTAAALLGGAATAHGQYYALANQITNVMRPAFSGSFAYRGMVELSGIGGVGLDRINTVELTTVQGFKYADWFFMGAGIGIDLAIGPDETLLGTTTPGQTRYKAMMPLFSDFRFNIGGESRTSFFVDLRVGAAWFFGDSWMSIHNNFIDNGTFFYLKPGLGVRIPVNSSDPTKAVNVAVTYQLLTNSGSYNYWRDRTVTMSGFGLTLGYEW